MSITINFVIVLRYVLYYARMCCTKAKGKKGSGNAENPQPTSNGGQHAESPNAEVDAEADAGAESDDDLMKRIKAEAAVLNSETAIAKEEWSVDTSAEAVKARTKAVEAGMGSLSMGGDEEGSDEDADSPYSVLGRWVQDNREVGPVEVYKKAEELGIAKKHKTAQVVVQALFTEKALTEIPKYVPLFVKVSWNAFYS